MPVKATQSVMRALFGTRNDRLIKMYTARAKEVETLEPQMRQLTDSELRAKTQAFRDRVKAGESEKQIRHEALAVAREVMDRAVGIRKIFNPELEFDPSQLPASARELYDQVQAEIATREPEPVAGGDAAPPWMQVEIPNALYEAVRELYPKSRPPFRARPFPVQIIGGMVLGEGAIAEMKTGEGKTIVAPLACYVAACENLQCHVVTVNDYLVQRDRDWVFPFYYWLGLTVGAIHPFHMLPPDQKALAYECDVVYGTNAEFGFDYLRDNMKLTAREQLQKRRDFCIIDEVDSILVDEARTPLIISGPARQEAPRYELADNLARHLIGKQDQWNAANEKVEKTELRIKGLEGDIRNSRDKAETSQMRDEIKQLRDELPQLEAARDEHTQYYEVEMERKAAHLTHDGIAEAQKLANIGSFYVGNNIDMPHLLENAIRAHAVYRRDKEYVVENNEVVIVDENTGRKMPGRQWSDGLHQAVESKEKVKVKEETQTLATVTIQNFAKLYQRLAGMTGTAVTEATEFREIYNLEVVVIPTNVPVVRDDRDDLIFLHEKDKWDAIVDEIKRVHDMGRPILVGTTSVEKSETLSRLLTRKYGIKHDVLNAKQHEREGEIVKEAGHLGSVMIATNMAGRGTDIMLRPFARDELVEHWQKRGLLPKQANAEMSDDQLLELAYRTLAGRDAKTLGLNPKDIDGMALDDVKRSLCRHWCEGVGFPEKKTRNMSLADAQSALDELPEFKTHRLEMWATTREMGGLYVIGTERHESRRIDNQLRGRSGRQGDPGTSRFFLALEDDLMQLFMPASMKSILAKMGMKEGEALEHPMVSRSVQKAQRKVEERNYQIRKNLLEYDEVMEYQRGDFYGLRQRVLDGDAVDDLIYGYIHEATDEACSTYLAQDYVAQQIAEWCRSTLGASVDPSRVILDDMNELEKIINKAASDDVASTIEVTLGEYMSNDIPQEDWDLQGLKGWAQSQYNVKLDLNWLRDANVDEVRDHLVQKAWDHVDNQDLSGLAKFFEENYGAKELAQWARNKFGIELVPEELAKVGQESAAEQIFEQAHAAYQRRELTYPAGFIINLVGQLIGQDPQQAMGQLLGFVKSKYDEMWGPDELNGKTPQEIHQLLVDKAEAWLRNGELEQHVDAKLAEVGTEPEQVSEFLKTRFNADTTPEDVQEAEDVKALCVASGRKHLRHELGQLERFVLLQILDQAWKDHLYAMDQLRDSINLRGYAERDPKIEYKREGSRYFTEMQAQVQDRVTELIFKAQLTANIQPRSAYGGAPQRQAVPAGAATAAQSAATQGTAEQQADQASAERAGSGEEGGSRRPMSRKQRRAMGSKGRSGGGSSGGGGNRRRKR